MMGLTRQCCFQVINEEDRYEEQRTHHRGCYRATGVSSSSVDKKKMKNSNIKSVTIMVNNDCNAIFSFSSIDLISLHI